MLLPGFGGVRMAKRVTPKKKGGGTELGQVMLMVQDAQRSKRFYVDVVGLEVNYDHGHFVSLKTKNGAWIGLHTAENSGMISAPGIELDFKVDDVDQEYERIKALGVKLKGAPVDQPWKWRTLEFADPDGYTVSMYTLKTAKPFNPHSEG